MEQTRFDDLAVIESRLHHSLGVGATATNYLQWIRDVVSPHIGSDVLDVGAGLGDVTAMVLQGGRRITAIEPSRELYEDLRARFDTNPNVVTVHRELDKYSRDQPFDSAYMINVLEHIEDHVGALRYLKSLLAPESTVVIYVPAHEFLYGQFDHDVGHFRRYTKRTLTRALAAAGFTNINATYLNSVGAIGWLAYCRMLGRSASDETVVSPYDKVVVPVVKRLESLIPAPFGISVVAYATNPRAPHRTHQFPEL
jgi:2-polyprenyl-3-methyl-5-hydroxy-6-metoxy-1,4-benzoquinol methylase